MFIDSSLETIISRLRQTLAHRRHTTAYVVYGRQITGSLPANTYYLELDDYLLV